MSHTIKVGDRVRFLDAVGGGEVTRVTKEGVIYVRDESGFELPVQADDVVPVTEGSTIAPRPVVAPSQPKPEPVAAPEPPAPVEDRRKRPSDPEHDRINAYLCYLPEDADRLGSSPFEAYLVNDSNYDLLVLYTSGRGEQHEVRYEGMIPFDSSEFLESFLPADVNDRAHVRLTLVPMKKGTSFAPRTPLVAELKVDGTKFFREGAFIRNDFFEDGAIVYHVVKDDEPYRRGKVDTEQLAEAMVARKKREDAPHPITHADRIVPKDEPVVVDLHIDQIIETTAGMSPKDILDYQLDYVRQVMEKYRVPKLKGTTVIFIHGKGEGVLRKAVIDLIHREYPRSSTRDASFAEYGFGATQVKVR